MLARLLVLAVLCHPRAAAADEEPPLESRLVLRYKQMELRPDRATAPNAYWRAVGALLVRIHDGVRAALDYQGKLPPEGAGAREHLVGVHVEFGL
jgi:hypothetical protein